MERLTNHFDYCKMIDCKYYDAELFKQGKCKFFDQSIEHCHEKRLNDKLREYEDLEEQGLLIKLPCKCDEVVWVAEKGFLPHKALYSCQSAMLEDIEYGIAIGYTKEEAEAALAEMR